MRSVRGERTSIHERTAETRQRLTISRFRIGRSRLRVLPSHASDPHDGFLLTVQDHQAHLQQNLELRDNALRGAILKALRAVTALQHKRLAPLGLGDLITQRIHFPGRHERWQAAKIRNGSFKRGGVRIGRLLCRWMTLPAGGVPVGAGLGSAHSLFLMAFALEAFVNTAGLCHAAPLVRKSFDCNQALSQELKTPG